MILMSAETMSVGEVEVRLTGTGSRGTDPRVCSAEVREPFVEFRTPKRSRSV